MLQPIVLQRFARQLEIQPQATNDGQHTEASHSIMEEDLPVAEIQQLIDTSQQHRPNGSRPKRAREVEDADYDEDEDCEIPHKALRMNDHGKQPVSDTSPTPSISSDSQGNETNTTPESPWRPKLWGALKGVNLDGVEKAAQRG